MAEVYKKNINPIRDFFLSLMFMNVDFNDENLLNDINNTLSKILQSVGVYEEELVYLDFKIKVKKNVIRIIPNNFICALWFIGALPEDPGLILEQNQAIVGDYMYKFNRKTKKLSKRKINNE